MMTGSKRVETSLNQQERSGASSAIPSWKINIALFGGLILVVLGYFFWQAEQTRQVFYNRVSDHSQMLAGVITFSLDNSELSQKAVEETIRKFLNSTAEFIDYLDSVDPFTTDELASFAGEAGLVGITILRSDGVGTEGPSGWSPLMDCQSAASSLAYYSSHSLYLFVLPRTSGQGCILVGYDASSAEELIKRIGVDRLLHDMTRLPLIKYVRLENRTTLSTVTPGNGIRIIRIGNNNVAETVVPFKNNALVVGIEADKYTKHVRLLWQEFILFSVILAGLGLFFSWLLNRYQIAFLERVRDFERQMAHQHEEAALGRAAATISHEIKNPLNAISIGLQRLKIETDHMSAEHQGLVNSMLQAVRRTSHIVSDLKRHTQPISPQYKNVVLHSIIEAALALYRAENISVSYDALYTGEIKADEPLLGQAIENLIKNGIEAQPDGGYLKVSLHRAGDRVVLIIENGGLTVDGSEVQNILEPYYTSKTMGTGLGLAISRRIIEAHHGTLTLESPELGVLRVTASLPIRNVVAGNPKQSLT